MKAKGHLFRFGRLLLGAGFPDGADPGQAVVGDEDLGAALLDQKRDVEHVLHRLPEVLRVNDEPVERKS